MLIKENVAEEVSRLKQQPGKDILVFGSGDLVHTLMQHDLIDEYRLMVFPVVVGSGKQLFKDGLEMRGLKLVDTKSFGCRCSYLPADTVASETFATPSDLQASVRSQT